LNDNKVPNWIVVSVEFDSRRRLLSYRKFGFSVELMKFRHDSRESHGRPSTASSIFCPNCKDSLSLGVNCLCFQKMNSLFPTKQRFKGKVPALLLKRHSVWKVVSSWEQSCPWEWITEIFQLEFLINTVIYLVLNLYWKWLYFESKLYFTSLCEQRMACKWKVFI